jgi:muconate cycloisomerase
MDIDRITVYDLKIPFSRTIRHRLFTRRETQSLIVVVQDKNGIKGFGEGTPREYVTGEALGESLKAAEQLSQAICNKAVRSFDELDQLLSNVGNSKTAAHYPAAFCAVETALLDLWSKLNHKTIFQLFNRASNRRSLSYSGVIPFTKKTGDLLKYVAWVKQLKLASLKVKVVDSESGLSQLKVIRERLGDQVDIRVDANSAFTAEAALSFIENATPFHLSAIEQPVAKDDLNGLKQVSVGSNIPVIADESMYTSKGPLYLIDNNYCHGLNIRLSSCGGFRKAYHTYRRAMAKRMMVVIGAHVGETAILAFAGRQLATLCPGATYLEGSFSKYVLEEDLVDDDIAFGPGGMAPVPGDFGLGIDIQLAAIERWSDCHADIGL